MTDELNAGLARLDRKIDGVERRLDNRINDVELKLDTIFEAVGERPDEALASTLTVQLY